MEGRGGAAGGLTPPAAKAEELLEVGGERPSPGAVGVVLEDGVNDEGQQPLAAVSPHLGGGAGGQGHTWRVGVWGSRARNGPRSHQTQRPGQQQSFAPDPSAVQQGGAQRLQPGPVAACLGVPQPLLLQLVPGLPTVLRTAGFILETALSGETLQLYVPGAFVSDNLSLPPSSWRS